MGWYDAYKPTHVNRVNVLPMTSSSGSAAKNFGDAFTKIGDSMLKVDKARSNEALIGAQTKLQNTKQKVQDFNLASLNDTKTQKSIDDAFSSDYTRYRTKDAFETHLKEDNIGGFDLASAPAKKEALDYFKKQDDLAQSKFNDTAIESSVTGGYKDMKTFVEKNPELVKNADGVTMAKIDKYFSSKDTTAAKLQSQKEKADTARKLLAMQAKLNKDKKTGGGFKYDASVDSKIAAQVKTAMGMDAPNFNFDDSVKKEYQDTVSGAAKISKKYNLEPSLAIHVYENPDLYEFTNDNKIILKKQKQEVQDKPKQSWKDYQ